MPPFRKPPAYQKFNGDRSHQFRKRVANLGQRLSIDFGQVHPVGDWFYWEVQ